MRSMTYVVSGNPIPLQRARYGNGRIYDKQKLCKQDYVNKLEMIHCDLSPFQGPLHLDIIFYMYVPKTSQKRALEMHGNYHHITPDLSNLLKFWEDCATMAKIYKDDALIASVNAKKIYCNSNPRTECTIKELKDL